MAAFCISAIAQVTPATSTTLIVAPGSASSGQAVTLTATVLAGNEKVTGGAVTFYNGLTQLGTVQISGETPVAGKVSGTAEFVTSFVPGTYSLVAKFDGTANAGPSTSGVVDLTISGTVPSLTSLVQNGPGEPFSFTATASGGGAQALTGSIELFDKTDSAVLSTIEIDSSQLQSGLSVKTPYRVGQKPVAIASGDFNGDGIPDLAIANSSAGTVTVLLGNATGGFTAEQTLDVGNDPDALAVADFNGDGILDLAVVNGADGTVAVFLGNHDQPGTFETLGSTVSVGHNPVTLAISDFNGDGVLDIAVANCTDDTITILLGNPSAPGTFNVFQTINVGPAPVALAAADFNGDGIEDLAVATLDDNSIWVLTGNPQEPGQLVSPRYITPVGNAPMSLAVGDFGNNGTPDLAVANYSDGTISILSGFSNGIFSDQQTLNAGSGPFSLAIGDFNRDGMSDIAVTNAGAGTIGVFLNQGNGKFQNEQAYQIATGPRQLITWLPSSGQGADLATVDINAGIAISLAEGSTYSGVFNLQTLQGTGLHQIQAIYIPSTASQYGTSASNVIDVNVNPVTGESQTISFPPLSAVVYGTSPISLTANASSGLPVSYKVVSGPGSINGAILSVTGAGDIVVEADQGGNATYASAPAVQQTLTVNKAQLVVTPANATRKYCAPNPAFTGTISGVVAGDNITATYASGATASTPVGTYTDPPYGISATVVDPLGRVSNYTLKLLTGTLTINQESQTINFAPLPAVPYGISPISLTANASSGLPVSYKVVSGPGSIVGTTLTITGAGGIVVEADQGGNATYAAAPEVQQTLTANKARLVVTPANVTRYYGAPNPAFTGTISGLVAGDNITATYASDATPSTPVGTYTEPPYGISATIVDPLSRASNYTLKLLTGTLTINAVTPGPISFPVPRPHPVPIPGPGPVPAPIPIPILPIGSGGNPISGGSPTAQDPSSRESQTISFAPLSAVIYGASPVGLTASASSGLPVSYKLVSGPGRVTGSTLTVTAAGEIVVEADQGGNATYAAAPAMRQSLTVSKASLVVTPANASRYYGEPNPAFTGTISGVVAGDNITATYASGATASTPIGTYSEPPYGISAIVVDPLGRARNYTLESRTGTLTIDAVTPGPISLPTPVPAPGPFPIPRLPIGPIGTWPRPRPVSPDPPRRGPRPPFVGLPPLPRIPWPIPVGPLPPIFSPGLTLSLAKTAMAGVMLAIPSRHEHRSAVDLFIASSLRTMSNGDEVTISVLARSSRNDISPTGAIDFWDGDNILKTTELNRDGWATVFVTLSGVGKHRIRAQYAGDKTFEPAASQLLDVEVFSDTDLLQGDMLNDLSRVPLQTPRTKVEGPGRSGYLNCDQIWVGLTCAPSKSPSSCNAIGGMRRVPFTGW